MTDNKHLDRIGEIAVELAELATRRQALLDELSRNRARLTIKCASCGNHHAIGDLTAIQTHHYTEPYSCSGGDYWTTSELHFVCPDTGVRNRLLFNTSDLGWNERRCFENDPAAQFKSIYGPLFKTVEKEYERETRYRSVINHYPDTERSKFGLVAKRIKVVETKWTDIGR